MLVYLQHLRQIRNCFTNIKYKVRLLFKFIIVSLVVTTVIFLLAYQNEKSRYLNSIFGKIENYNQKIYKNIRAIQKIEDIFDNLEKSNKENLCKQKIYLTLQQHKKFIIKCDFTNVGKGFELQEVNHGGYRNILITKSKRNNKHKLTLEISDNDFIRLLDANFSLNPFIIILQNKDKQINLKKDLIPSKLFKKEYNISKNFSYIVSYDQNMINSQISAIRNDNIQNYIMCNILAIICYMIILMIYDKPLINPYIRKIRLLFKEKEFLNQEIKILKKQLNKENRLKSIMKDSYLARINLLKIMHDEMKQNILSIVHKGKLGKENIDEIWNLIREKKGYKIEDINVLINNALDTIIYNAEHANIKITIDNDITEVMHLSMPKYIALLTINILFFNIVKRTIYNGKLNIRIINDHESVNLIFKIDKIICSNNIKDNDQIFLSQKKIRYYLGEYNGKYIENTKNGITEIIAKFPKGLDIAGTFKC